MQLPAVELLRGLLQLPWQLPGLLEDAPHDDMELNRSMLATGEGGAITSCMLPARKEAALAVIDCSIVTEAPDRDGGPSRCLSGACGANWDSVSDLQSAVAVAQLCAGQYQLHDDAQLSKVVVHCLVSRKHCTISRNYFCMKAMLHRCFHSLQQLGQTGVLVLESS